MSTSLRGTNLAGGEWAYDPAVAPVAGTNYQWVSHQDIDYLAGKGVAFVRVVFSWEILQPALNGPLDPAYGAAMLDVVTHALGKGMHVMIEPHGGEFSKFARYKGNPVGSAAVPNSAFANLWTRLAQLHKGRSRVIFGLTNEPNDISTMQWYHAAQAAITAIRAAGAPNLIMVPGNGFTQPSTWKDSWYDTAVPPVSNAVGWLTLHDPFDNMVASVHTYFDADGGGGGSDIADPNIIAQRLQPVVDWARANNKKVHLSEFGADAANPDAQAAVANAIAYMDANADVIIGWAWWAYGPPAFWGGYRFTLCPTGNYAVDDPKMAWLAPHFDAPTVMYIPDNAADTGTEPNATTTIGWESTDVWVRQTDDHVAGGEDVKGGQPCVVYVKVHNSGAWPGTGSQVVRLYWAKAGAGLSYPAPWNGANALQGGPVDVPRPIPPIASGQTWTIGFPWTAPNPADYGGDSHFCLLAHVAVTESAQFEGFSGSNLNENVLKLNRAAWRNIHILTMPKPPGGMMLGDVVMSNGEARAVDAHLVFELLDAAGRRTDPRAGTLTAAPRGAARERLREHRAAGRYLEEMGDGVFRVLDPAAGLPPLTLAAGERLAFALEYTPAAGDSGYAVRAIQRSADGGAEAVVGGQTFVVGHVEGLSARRPSRSGCAFWPWAAAAAAILAAAALLGFGRKRR
jgi:endoglucanase